MLTNIIEKLDLSNYKTLQDKISSLDPSYPISALNLINWKFYNINVFFKITEDAVYIYSFFEGEKEIYIFRPIISLNNQYKMKYYYKMAILNIEDRIKYYQNLHFVTQDQRDLVLFKKPTLFKTFNANYIYPTDQLKFMLGRKMQKKRNFVNRFRKSFSDKSKIIKYSKEYYADVLEFCKKFSIDKQTKEIRTNEISGIKELLSLELENGYGSILFYDDEIIGFTYGVIHDDFYEIFIEKANESLKGSFQYLLLNNLQLNTINTSFIDRQDDMDDMYLRKSKKSYKPKFINKLYFFEVKNIK